jgi:hypothetical protein
MKTSFIRTVKISIVAIAAFLFASQSFAKSFPFQKIEIKYSDGKTTKVDVNTDGTFASPKLQAGTYTLSWVFNNGPRQTTSVDGSLDGRSSIANGSSGRESSIPSVSEITVSYSVQMPRGSHAESEKRQHVPPVVIRLNDSERVLPTVNKKIATVTIDDDCDGITGKVSLKDQNGKTMAADDWHETK